MPHPRLDSLSSRRGPLTRLLLIGSLLWGALPASGTTSPIAVTSTPLTVEFYQRGARVVRAIELEVPGGGAHTVRVGGLPTHLARSDISARLIDGSGLIIDRITYSPAREDMPYRPADLVAAEQQVDQLYGELRALEFEQQAIRAELDHRSQVLHRLHAALESNPSPTVLELTEAAHRAAVEATRTQRAPQTELEQRSEALKADLVRAEAALRAAREAARALAGGVEIELRADRSGRRVLHIEYLEPAANWSARYQVRADTAADSVELMWQAQLRQNSFEDWSQVRVVLSTAPGVGGGDVRDLPPIFLQPWVAAPAPRRDSMRVAMAPMAAAPAPPEVKAMQADEAIFELEDRSATVSAGLTQFQIELPGTHTIAGRNQIALAPVMSRTLTSSLWSEAAPRLDTTAYLRAKLTNDFDTSLPAGLTEIFVDGVRSGQGQLPATLPGSEFELNLGRNDNLRIEFKVVVSRGGERGFIGRTRTYEREFLTTVNSRMARPHPVRLRDQVPVARDQKIEVKVLQPAAAPIEPDSGRFSHAVTLQPGASVSFTTQYTVTTPADMTLDSGF
jgi:uncharacterized protein (TIGR02231 family)